MGVTRAKRAGQRSRTVREDWFAWLPSEMDQLFDATRNELECSNVILSVALNEALALCEQGEFDRAKESATVFADLFDRLAVPLSSVIRTIKEHGSHFGTLPNVSPLVSSNFRGATAQRISRMSGLLAKVVFRGRTRFFHKLDSLGEIIDELQKETRSTATDVTDGSPAVTDRAWQELEVLGYDLNTCMGETTVILKSFFCALPADELEAFSAQARDAGSGTSHGRFCESTQAFSMGNRRFGGPIYALCLGQSAQVYLWSAQPLDFDAINPAQRPTGINSAQSLS